MEYVGNHDDGFELIQKLVKQGGTVKATNISYDGFKAGEGNKYTVTIRATAPDGKLWWRNLRRVMLFEFETRSGMLDPNDNDKGKVKTEPEIIKDMVYNICQDMKEGFKNE